MLLLAVGEGRTLSGAEEARFHAHVGECEICRTLTSEAPDEQLRWVARIPEDAFDDPDLLVLPTVDPIVFTKGEELARGGMGRITRAHDRRLGRDVAIKEVLAPYLRARFEREAMITAKLQHPAIVPIYEAGTWPDGSAFYTMRLVSGGTLAEAMEKTRTLEERLALLPHVVALTEALGYAHSRRIVHRDLKPGNVLVGEFGETVVIDWGLAKELDRADGKAEANEEGLESPELTRAGSVVGTPCFIAPEQAAGTEIDERADVYALGAILYNLLAGHPPHWDSTEHSADRLLDAAREVPPTPLEKLAPRTPADLRAIVERAMARDKEARYPTAKEMAEELRRFEAGQLLGSREYGLRELVVRWIRRHRAAVAVGAAAIAVLAIGGIVSVQQIVAREHETKRALAESQLERGRQLLVDGDPDQAAPYLAAALAELPDDPVARQLAAIALRDVPRRLGSFAGTAVAFRRDGAELAIGRADGSIAVIDPATAVTLQTPRVLPSLGGSIAQLDYSPDGALLAVASATGAYLRDVRSGARTATASLAPSSEVRFLAGTNRVAVVTATTVQVVELGGNRVVTSAPLVHPHGLVVSSDGGRLVVLTDDGAMLWRADDLAHPTEIHAKESHFAAVFDHDDVILAGLDGVTRWHDGQRTATLVSWAVSTLSWIADGTLLADGSVVQTNTGGSRLLQHNVIQDGAAMDATHVITGGYDHTLRVWDLERSARPIIVLDAADVTGTLAVDPTGRRAISRGVGPGARIELWDVASVPARTFAIGGHADSLVVDGDRIAVQVGGTTRLVTTELAPIHPASIEQDTLDGWPLRFRPHHDEFVSGNEGVLEIYSRDGKHLFDVPGDDRELRTAIGQNKLWHVAFSSAGTEIAIGSERRIWRLDAGWRPVAASPTIEEPEGTAWISALALDDHGHIITGYQDGTLKIWDARTGALLTTKTGHVSTISTLEVRGDTVISTSWDPTLRLWAVPSGEPRGVFKKLSSVAMSPSRRQLVTVDGSAAVSLWDGAQDRLLQQIPTAHAVDGVAFIDEDHVVASSAGGQLELVDLSVQPRTVDEVMRLVAAAPRWHLVHGLVVERR